MATLPLASGEPKNSTYTNPILPGWHSDPSCTFIAEEDNTFFCTVSTFLTFPGIPICASKDLYWKLGKFYPLMSYVSMVPIFQANGLLFTTEDIYSNQAWSNPVRFQIGDIDPDLFWDDDDDGTAYILYARALQQTIDLETGVTGPATRIWSRTGGATPEGPHIYKKDGWYYLCIGEGGTELGHYQTIARSKHVSGPYNSYEGSPILTNANTTEYFQTVGHADLFQDGNEN